MQEPEETGPCVLVADDDPDMLEEVTRTLRGGGCRVIPVASGDLLIDYLGRCASFGGRFLVPDVIVSDIRMAGYSGFDLLNALREAQCDTPIILMTAFGDQRTHEQAKRLGAVTTFDKPFDAGALLTAILWAWCPTGASAGRRRRHQSNLPYGEGLRARDADPEYRDYRDAAGDDSEPDGD